MIISVNTTKRGAANPVPKETSKLYTKYLFKPTTVQDDL